MEEILELLNAGQYLKLRQLVTGFNVADIAAYMEELERDDLLKLFRILPKAWLRMCFLIWNLKRSSILLRHCQHGMPRALLII